MNKFLIIMMLSTFSLAEFKNTNILSIDESLVINEFSKSDKEKTTNVTRISVDTYNDYYSDNYYITSGISYYKFDEVYNTMSDSTVKADSYLTLTELSFNYTYDKHTLTAGIVPLYNGTINKYQGIEYQKSDSLPFLFNSIVQGAFYTYKDSNVRITLGRGYYEKIKVNDIKMYDKVDEGTRGSYSDYMFVNYKQDNNNIIFNYAKTHWSYFDTELYTQDLGGITYILDDSTNSGNTFYMGMGYQQGSGNNYMIAKDKLEASGITQDFSNTVLETQDFYVGPFETSGSFYVVGLRKDFDIMKKEHFLLLEHFETKDDWLSQNSGEPLSFWGTGRLGKQNKVVLGHYINPNLLVKLMYCNIEQELDYKDGGSAVTQDINSFSTDRVKDFESYTIGLSYKF